MCVLHLGASEILVLRFKRQNIWLNLNPISQCRYGQYHSMVNQVPKSAYLSGPQEVPEGRIFLPVFGILPNRYSFLCRLDLNILLKMQRYKSTNTNISRDEKIIEFWHEISQQRRSWCRTSLVGMDSWFGKTLTLTSAYFFQILLDSLSTRLDAFSIIFYIFIMFINGFFKQNYS